MTLYLWLGEVINTSNESNLIEQETDINMTVIVSDEAGLRADDFGKYQDIMLVTYNV